MKKIKYALSIVFLISIYSSNVVAQNTDVVNTISKSSDHSSFYSLLQQTELQNTLKGAGPYTIFAPSDVAFKSLKAGLLDFMLKPENKQKLAKLINTHIVIGNYDEAKLLSAFKSNNNTITLGTLAGTQLKLSIQEGIITITDPQGGKSIVRTPFVNAGNGLIYTIDHVLLPL
ncbi:MAG: fasciclin domain-containing protein [Bacteroidota bacterium]|jgi:uncharacterized surface protein with fasciclin (FAS1) repeats